MWVIVGAWRVTVWVCSEAHLAFCKKKGQRKSTTGLTLCLYNSFLPLHSIPFFHFFNFSNPSNYSIPFYFFSTIFFNFPNPYTISLNLNHSYYLKISKVKPFLHHFYKPFSNYSKPFSNSFFHTKKWSKMAKMTKPNKRYNMKNSSKCTIFDN